MRNRSYNRMSYAERMNIIKNREVVIKQVFPLLRKRGVLANANYLCCQSCAGYALATKATEKNKAGYVFWHRQDEDRVQADGGLYLAYTGSENVKNPPTASVSTQVVGDMTARLLREAGLEVEWDGNTDTRIFVDLKKPLFGRIDYPVGAGGQLSLIV